MLPAKLGLAFLASTVLSTAVLADGYSTKAQYALLMDANTGYVMFDKKSNEPMHPASMTKLMTAYMVDEALKAGKFKLDNEFEVSDNAWQKGGAKTGGSTMFLKPHQKVRLDDLLKGIIVQSGNDACIVVAENMAGTEEAFAAQMTQKAKKLGMTNSTFKNSTGLPDKEHLMSAKDLAILSQHIINDFPEHYQIYSQKEFTYNGIKQGNRNPLLYTLDGADGLKTGHTSQSGYGLAASVKSRDGRRLIMVINGLKSMNERADEARKLMSWGLANFQNSDLLPTDKSLAELDVWLGKNKTVHAVPAKNLIQTHAVADGVKATSIIQYQQPVLAPVQKGQKLGKIITTLSDNTKVETDLIATESVEKLGFFGKIKALFGG